MTPKAIFKGALAWNMNKLGNLYFFLRDFHLDASTAEDMQQARLSTFFVGQAKKRRRDSVHSHNSQADETAVERPQKHSKNHADDNAASSASDDVDIALLLDFTSLTSLSVITDRFDEIANALFHDYNLLLTNGEKQTTLEILELEFYLQKSGLHEDPFTHGSEEQKQSGRWSVTSFIYSLFFRRCDFADIRVLLLGISIAHHSIRTALIRPQQLLEVTKAVAAKG